jgi:hypothetical protein
MCRWISVPLGTLFLFVAHSRFGMRYLKRSFMPRISLFRFPRGKEGVLAEIRKNIQVLSESYEEKGVFSR